MYADATSAVVYFKDPTKKTPEEKLAEYRLPSDVLEPVVDPAPDLELDHLPPYQHTAGKHGFKRKKTDVTIDQAKDLFFRTYPLGFNDPSYFDPMKGEREYKLAAHRRYWQAMDAGLEHLTERPSEIRGAIWRIYDGLDHKAVAPLNVLDPRFEAPRFFDALDNHEWAVAYLRAALAFTADRSTSAFDALADVMSRMPGVEPSRTGRWPYATWLPFVAEPERHIAIRLTYIEEFASAAGFDIAYSSELDFQMYERVCRLCERLLGELDASGLNAARRPLDFIDAQSFMWVARRYSEPGFEGPA